MTWEMINDQYFFEFHQQTNNISNHIISLTNKAFLSLLMQMLFKGFPENCDALKSLRDGASTQASAARWSIAWETHALPLIREVLSG